MASFDVTVRFQVKGNRKLALILDKLSDTIHSYSGVVTQEDGSVVSIEIEEATQ